MTWRVRQCLWILTIFGGTRAAVAQTTSPHGEVHEACATCHRPEAWLPARISREFQHAPRTFPLTGAHAQTSCTSCHKQLSFTTTPASCASCHADLHKGELGSDCARCHTTRSFTDPPAMRQAHELTRFPLRGAHAVAACESCHLPSSPGQTQFANRNSTCVGCHVADFQRAKMPDHQAAGFSRECASCHTQSAWTGVRFDHAATKMPLTGAHRAVPCNQCHNDGAYNGKPTSCVSCHLTTFNATTNPSHSAAAFPTTCESCHTTTAWPGARFNHLATLFPLTGAHQTATCKDCHGDGVYRGKPADCYSCHRTEYVATTAPSHSAAVFPTTCVSCHTTTTWIGATFDHDSKWFPIYSGKHLGRWKSCTECHPSQTLFSTFTCLTCHLQSTTDSHHQGQSGYRYDSQACYACHPRGSH